jgi:hypothetical protein
LRAIVVLAALLAFGTPACAAEESGVVLPPAPSVPNNASIDPGIAPGCADVDLPLGRLRGTVYTVPVHTRALPDFAALAPAGSICLDRLDVTDRRGYPGFPGVRDRYEWFAVDLQGVLQVRSEGVVQFRLTSDDGAKLLVDRTVVIDNDGYHNSRSLRGAARLTAGTHVIDVPYWQGPGPMELRLEVADGSGPFRVLRMDEPLAGAGD